MKTLFRTIRIFYSTRFLLVLCVAAPVLFTLIALLLGSVEPVLSYTLGALLVPVATIIGDYFVFNGCFKADAPTRLICASFYGRKFMARGLLVDQLLRFVLITGELMIFIFVGKVLGAADIKVAILDILVVYAISTFSLLLFRHISVLGIYMILSSVVSSLSVVLMAVIYYLYFSDMLIYQFWIIPAFIAALGATIAVVEIHRNAFEKSIGR